MGQQPRALDPARSPRALFGWQLRRLRETRNLSQEALGTLVHLSGAAIGTYEKGRSLPAEQESQHLDRALAAHGLLHAAWQLASRSLEHGDTRAHSRTDDPHVEPWQISDALTRSSISDETIDAMQDAVFGYAAAYPSTPPAELKTLVHRQGHRLAQALNESQRTATRRKCVQLTTIVCGLSANLAIDLADTRSAAAYFRTAHIAAAEADDPELAAWVFANQSIQAFFDGRPETSVELLNRSSALLEHAAAPRQQAWTNALLARSLAASGERAAAAQAVEAAHAQLERALEPPGGIMFFDAPRLEGLAGTTYLLAGDTARAKQQLTSALTRRPETDRKGRVFLSLDLAACHAAAGDVDQAYQMAAHALDLADGTVIQPIVVRAREVHARMAAQGSSRSVRELEARVAALDELQED